MVLRDNMNDLLDITKWRLSPYQILALGFAGLILFGALLLTTPAASATGERVGFIDALFTATSAACVTGLKVVDTGTTFSLFGQLVIIGLIQIGGLGIMTMATLMALLMGKKIRLKERLVMQQELHQVSVSGVVRLTQYIIKATLLIEGIGGAILAYHWWHKLGPAKAIYYGYWHAVSAFCNSGFDLFGDFRSFSRYVDDATVVLTVTTLVILGGIGFAVIVDVWENRRLRKISLHSKVVLASTAFLILFGMIVILAMEVNNPDTLQPLSMKGKLLASYFQSVTARTGGFSSVYIGHMADSTLFFLVILMFIGASPGSAGGGVKTSTVAVLAAAIWAMIRGREDVQMYSRRIPSSLVYKAFAITFLAAGLIIFVTMVLSISENATFLSILFEVVSAFATVGLSAGLTTELTLHGKVWIILTMFAGRVGPVTLAMALAMRQERQLIKYPEGKVIIG
ncbi:MAG: TrkH family potassium uptake protein [Negativicutes bacterium]|nr:TrkH family potassium uptake protein [Negativicutes bacterium]